jgi:glutamyl-tRNA synthetase
VGNVRTALMNVLFARKHDGAVLLRIDDTDTERSTLAFETAIKADLAWLGLKWDDSFNQSERFAHYEAARDVLIGKGLLYPCYETEDELDRKRKIQRAQSKPPVYDRAALSLSEADRAQLEAQGRKPHWRFKLSGGRIAWTDLVRGDSHIETSSVSDPILIRADGSYLYTLPSVVDDIAANVTHIIRGEDHVTNSAAQIEIFEALGGPGSSPALGHMALLVGADGDKLSKRLGSLSIESLREEEGFEPMAITSLLAKIGTSDPVEVRESIEALAADFDFAKLSRTPARFDSAELARLNARLMHAMGYDEVKERLIDLGADGGEAFWAAVRPNLERVRDVIELLRLVEGPVEPVIEDADYIATAADLLPQGDFTLESWGQWTSALKEQTGRKGRDLFKPLRQALTGQERGPEMDQLLMLIGPARAKQRLAGETA